MEYVASVFPLLSRLKSLMVGSLEYILQIMCTVSACKHACLMMNVTTSPNVAGNSGGSIRKK